jgi:hypothetical protein
VLFFVPLIEVLLYQQECREGKFSYRMNFKACLFHPTAKRGEILSSSPPPPPPPTKANNLCSLKVRGGGGDSFCLTLISTTFCSVKFLKSLGLSNRVSFMGIQLNFEKGRKKFTLEVPANRTNPLNVAHSAWALSQNAQKSFPLNPFFYRVSPASVCPAYRSSTLANFSYQEDNGSNSEPQYQL